MSSENGANRWWENYLVRYLMPSIAGAAIVNWLASAGNNDIKRVLLIDITTQGLQTPTLVLLFLYGNLFCYISSYPILGFHVTRVIDFERRGWRKFILDGYFGTMFLAGIVLLMNSYGNKFISDTRAIPFVIVIAFACLQLYRVKLAMCVITIDGLSGPVSKVFAYTYALAKRRGVAEELRITKQSAKDQEDLETGDKFDEETEWQKRSVWRREFIDTYRHMREHGNSAFIFILELTLAGLCYLLLSAHRSESAVFQLSALGILFAIWALPAMFIHFLGQHIERRFSWYDRKATPRPSNMNETGR